MHVNLSTVEKAKKIHQRGEPRLVSSQEIAVIKLIITYSRYLRGVDITLFPITSVSFLTNSIPQCHVRCKRAQIDTFVAVQIRY